MTQRVDKDSLPLDKPRRTPNHPTKSHIVKTKVDGKEKIIRFGEQGASTAGKPKAGESERMKAKRASFKARHAKNIAKGKSSPAYWADRVKWAEGGAVRNRQSRGTPALDLIEQMRRSASRSDSEFNVAGLARNRRPERMPVPPIPPTAPTSGVLDSRATPVQAPQNFPGETANDATPTRQVTYDGNNPLVRAAAEAAQRYNIPVPLFLAQIQQESRFNPTARSRVGAFGPGQLMPETARELGVDINDPIQNLDGAARYMRQQLDRFGEIPLALAAYNAGPGRVQRAGNVVSDIRETRNYVSTIMRNAGIPGYAEGGLADLDRKYAEGGAVTSGPLTYDPDQIDALARQVTGDAEPEGYAEGGEVSSPEDKEYDRRLLERWRRDEGYRVDNPTWPEQRAALARAGREAADMAADLLLPQSPLDFALMAALGPGGRAVRIPAAAALAAMEPSEAEAGRVRNAARAVRGVVTPSDAPVDDFPTIFYRGIPRIQGQSSGISGLHMRERGPAYPPSPHLAANTRNYAWASDNPGVGSSYTHFGGVVVPLELTERPQAILDAQGALWQDFFFNNSNRSGRSSRRGLSLNPEFREALEDPNVRAVLVRNVVDFGAESQNPKFLDWLSQRLYGRSYRDLNAFQSHDLLDPGLRGNNLLIKDPSVVRYRLTGEPAEFARGGKVEAGLNDLYQRYYEGGGVGDPSDNDSSASTAEGQAAAGGVSGEGAGSTGAGAGSPADSGPDMGGGYGGGYGSGSSADPEGTAAAANMNTAAQAAAAGYGYDPTTGFAGTGVGPTGFHADPGAFGALSGMLSGTISPAQALGYAMQSSIPGATIGTQIDEFGNARPAANVDFGTMLGTIGGSMLGLATGLGPGAGRVGGAIGSAIGRAAGYEPGVVSYSPGVYSGPETPETSGDDYLRYGSTYGSAPQPAAQPLRYNYGYGPSWSPYYQGVDFR